MTSVQNSAELSQLVTAAVSEAFTAMPAETGFAFGGLQELAAVSIGLCFGYLSLGRYRYRRQMKEAVEKALSDGADGDHQDRATFQKAARKDPYLRAMATVMSVGDKEDFSDKDLKVLKQEDHFKTLAGIAFRKVFAKHSDIHTCRWIFGLCLLVLVAGAALPLAEIALQSKLLEWVVLAILVTGVVLPLSFIVIGEWVVKETKASAIQWVAHYVETSQRNAREVEPVRRGARAIRPVDTRPLGPR